MDRSRKASWAPASTAVLGLGLTVAAFDPGAPRAQLRDPPRLGYRQLSGLDQRTCGRPDRTDRSPLDDAPRGLHSGWRAGGLCARAHPTTRTDDAISARALYARECAARP